MSQPAAIQLEDVMQSWKSTKHMTRHRAKENQILIPPIDTTVALRGRHCRRRGRKQVVNESTSNASHNSVSESNPEPMEEDEIVKPAIPEIASVTLGLDERRVFVQKTETALARALMPIFAVDIEVRARAWSSIKTIPSLCSTALLADTGSKKEKRAAWSDIDTAMLNWARQYCDEQGWKMIVDMTFLIEETAEHAARALEEMLCTTGDTRDRDAHVMRIAGYLYSNCVYQTNIVKSAPSVPHELSDNFPLQDLETIAKTVPARCAGPFKRIEVLYKEATKVLNDVFGSV